ncbi:MAG: 2-oxo acid dehydrogenase subunit E2 [Anaerolineales bacterium]|uniref:Dihydrolipoamide acetyltransferase component of pyruvate dehydrogenase complex n=1 Tax=Candidatus Desulfolinea nitratireducens TaxID=2841698 RepID=A0A8J6TJB1_9CHLR|nr:2-oxo acid dehydrogenase subunit E2 [Candidatus Desulfolinea nitratireducens]MBL6961960.1 2-oxo acid dehydrogenase subunit E2 [Anaerolineales bacterium]
MAEIMNMPKLGFDMAEGTLIQWAKAEGDTVSKGDVLADIETDKVTVEIEATADGTILKLLVNEGDIVPVTAPILIIGEPGEEVDLPVAGESETSVDAEVEVPSVQATPSPAPVEAATPDLQPDLVKASPLAKKVARDKNVNLSQIAGTGPGGRIVRRDVEAAAASGQASVSLSAPAFMAVSREDKNVPLTRLRQAIGRRLVEVNQEVPQFFVTHDYKMEAILAMRSEINSVLPEGEKLSVNDFVVKAVALTLREFPNLNASLVGNSVTHHGAINVGNAVAVEGGLLTVVCKNADQKSLRQISLEVKTMASQVRAGKIRPDDIEGSTFSISNLGMFEVEHFIAIINPPEAAILALGSAMEVPVVEEGEIKAGWRMKATISVDHRISDGAEAAQFMQALAKYIETPLLMMA